MADMAPDDFVAWVHDARGPLIWLSNQHLAVLAWDIESGQITRIADYSSMGNISVAADYLP